MHAALICLLVMATVAPSAAPTLAAPDRPSVAPTKAAEAWLEKGARDLREGRPGDALAAFKAARTLVNSPKISFDMALAEKELGLSVEAMGDVQEFISSNPRDAETRAYASQLADELRKQVVSVDISGAGDGSEIWIDEQPHGTVPLHGPLYVTPQPHRYRARRAGVVTADKTVAGQPGSTLEVDLSATRPPAGGLALREPPAPAPDGGALVRRPQDTKKDTTTHGPRSGHRWVWIALGAVVAIGATTAILFASRGDSYPTPSLGTKSLMP